MAKGEKDEAKEAERSIYLLRKRAQRIGRVKARNKEEALRAPMSSSRLRLRLADEVRLHAMTNQDRIVKYLESISPRAATNSQIRAGTQVKPHQQVFQITQHLMNKGIIEGRQRGHEWEFWLRKKG